MLAKDLVQGCLICDIDIIEHWTLAAYQLNAVDDFF